MVQVIVVREVFILVNKKTNREFLVVRRPSELKSSRSTSSMTKMTSLANLSRKELLATCELLIKEVGAEKAQVLLAGIVKPVQISKLSGETSTAADEALERGTKKQRKDFDFSRYPQKQVAFWVGYFGENYTGLATAGSKSGENDQTVEWSLLEALKKVKLIDPNGNFESWSYSRCGRTDKGVSGLGQVISMRVRWAEGDKEMDYASMLNGNLPKDILVLAWAPVLDKKDTRGVSDNAVERPFNARFDCVSRTYRYFFRSSSLDLAKMRKSCALLEGTHDFRNFCKVDLDNASTFQRKIESCRVVEGECLHEGVCFVEVRGSAFLWHQIRLIMAVLFHVGAGLEEPSIVSKLLDVERCPARPSFAMASELPLLLHASEFEPDTLPWKFSEKNIARLVSRLHDRLGNEIIRCELTKSFLDVLTSPPFPKVTEVNDLDHEECCSQAKRTRHKPFMDRIMCKSVNDRLLERAASTMPSDRKDKSIDE